MASRVDYAVSCVPICAVAAGENLATETLCTDVAKGLGASGSATVTWGATIGYAAGVPAYVTTGATIGTGTTIGTLTSVKFVYIKHTGCLFSSSAVLGAATTYKVTVCMNATVAAATTIAVLNPGEAIVLPYNTATTPTIFVAPEAAFAVAVEVMATA